MKPSFYNFYQNSDKNTLIYNTISGNCVVVPKESNEQTNQEKLNEMGFYVSDTKDELKELVTKGEKRLKHTDYNKYRVLTTTACNARCTYCYEKGVQTFNMNLATADKVADFIVSQNHHQHLIGIEWFGGEPLLNTKVIDYISDKILKSKSSETEYESYMVTNGNLLTEDIVDKMKNTWCVKRVQITLDGVGSNYENVKGLPVGSFEKVIHNIQLLCKKRIKINIRLNYDQHNMDNMRDIIQYLSGLDFKESLCVYPAPIFDAIPKSQSELQEKEMKDAELQMYDLLYNAGLIKPLRLLPHTMPTPCAASKPGYFTINANGDIFKCDRQFLQTNKVGSVFNNPYLEKDVSVWSKINVRQRCKKCKMFPLCWGGCIFEVMSGVDRCHFSEEVIKHNLALLLNKYESISSSEKICSNVH